MVASILCNPLFQYFREYAVNQLTLVIVAGTFVQIRKRINAGIAEAPRRTKSASLAHFSHAFKYFPGMFQQARHAKFFFCPIYSQIVHG